MLRSPGLRTPALVRLQENNLDYCSSNFERGLLKVSQKLTRRRAEFAANVWNHAADPFQASFDNRPPLAKDEVAAIRSIVERCLDNEAEAASRLIEKDLARDGDLMAHCLQIVGLTRNKILQDLKGATRTGTVEVHVPTSFLRLPGSEAWNYAGPYLTQKIRTVFRPFTDNRDGLSDAIEAINQATWPGYIRQERAKRSGHEAEFRLAALHQACGLPFQPEEKARNPLCRDAQIHSVSFDLVVPAVASPLLCVKSTVHTSNIGQYGESKDHLEVDEAKKMLDGNFANGSRPILLALIDGVGFESNRAGLDGVLSKADEFCQFNTIWKAIMISAHLLKHPLEFALPTRSISAHKEFLSRHGANFTIHALESYKEDGDEIEAGEALIILP